MPPVLSKYNIAYPCNLCTKPVASNHRALCCDICDQWVHIKCNAVSPSDYELLKSSDSKWFCIKCIGEVFPRSTNLFSDSTNEADCDSTPPDVDFSPLLADQAKAKFLNTLFSSKSSILDEPTDEGYVSDDDDDDSLPSLNCRYYDAEGLRTSLDNLTNNNFSAFHLNIASLPCHFDELHTLLQSLNHTFSVVALTETKIQSTIVPETYCLENYIHFHTPSEAGKGGALLFVNKELSHFSRSDINSECYSSKELESTFVEFPSDVKGEQNLIVGCIYRHPSMKISTFNSNYLKPLLYKISKENKRILLLGDFNIDLLNVETQPEISNFVDNLSSLYLLPTVNIPTRITSTSKTLIDNIFCNFSDPTFLSGNLVSAISDHLPQFLITTNTVNSKPISNLSYRDWSKFKQEEFVLDYLDIDWNTTLKLENECVDTSFNAFLDSINALIDNHIPIKTCKRKRRLQTSKPWITRGIINSMHKRDKLFKAHIKCNDPNNKKVLEAEFKALQN